MQFVNMGYVYPFQKAFLLCSGVYPDEHNREEQMDMLFHQSNHNTAFRLRVSEILLVSVWLGGLLLGAFLSPFAPESYLLLMRRAAGSPVSIVGLFASVLLPFLIATYAVSISKPVLLYAVCFCKAVLFSFCCRGIQLTFGSAGWLVLILMQFSDLCMLPVLCWFSFRHLGAGTHRLKRDFAIGCGIGTAVGILDYCMVSPFLVMLIDF